MACVFNVYNGQETSQILQTVEKEKSIEQVVIVGINPHLSYLLCQVIKESAEIEPGLHAFRKAMIARHKQMETE